MGLDGKLRITPSMKANTKMVIPMGTAEGYTLMAVIIKECGKGTQGMVKDNCSIKMGS